MTVLPLNTLEDDGKAGQRLKEEKRIVVSMKNIEKSFAGIHALSGAGLTLMEGQVLGLIGENGAGKSTLMNILSGVLGRDGGEIWVQEKSVDYKNPAEALADGICMIHQELNLMPQLSVADNIFIGRESRKGPILFRSRDAERAKALLDDMGVTIPVGMPVGELSVAKQQMVEIAKGISSHSRILIMDEPTAALSGSEIADLFRLIRQLKENGVSIIYISHRLEELFEITDSITVMRDGAYIDTIETSSSKMEQLIRMMVGRVIYEEPKSCSRVGEDAAVVLEAKHLSSGDIKDASFELREGEILGIAGLMGAGRTELARLLFGADKRKGGEIFKDGKEIHIRSPLDAVRHGIGYLSEDRKELGLAVNLSISDNVSLTCLEEFTHMGVVQGVRVKERVRQEIEKISVKTPSVDQLVRNLSGGNQQKVVIAKWLIKNCQIFIFDEPTRGIDVGAKSEIYKLMNALVEEGKSIIMISSEMPELLRMSDRILVMCEGRITGKLLIQEATQEKIMRLATPCQSREEAWN